MFWTDMETEQTSSMKRPRPVGGAETIIATIEEDTETLWSFLSHLAWLKLTPAFVLYCSAKKVPSLSFSVPSKTTNLEGSVKW